MQIFNILAGLCFWALFCHILKTGFSCLEVHIELGHVEEIIRFL